MRRHFYGWLLTLAALSLTALTQQPARSRATSASTLGTRVYLPMVMRPLQGLIIFSSSTDANGRPSPPMTMIGANERKLNYSVTVHAALGQPYRIEYYLPTGLFDEDSGTISSDPFESLGTICYSSADDCSEPTGTLAPGTYTIRVFIDNQLLSESSVTVLAGLDEPHGGAAAQRVVQVRAQRP